MAKWSFATLAMALLVVLPAQQSNAQLKPIKVDGCAKLARVVYSEVSSSAMFGTDRAGPWTIDLGEGDLVICSHTAKTVSQAFTSAMLRAGVDVSWGRGDTDSGDFCWSGFLSQCYPDRQRLAYSTIGSDADFVQKSWSVVSQAVMREMYNPFSSDEIRFRDSDLKLRMGLSLRSVSRDDRR
jgi:hypothetical protein